MKREDLYNGVTDIDDELIDGAAEAKKKRRAARLWVPAAAAVLAVAVGLTALWPRGQGPSAGGPTPPGQTRPAVSEPAASGSDTPAPAGPTPPEPASSESAPVEDPMAWWDEPMVTPSVLEPPEELPHAVSLAAYPVLEDSFKTDMERRRFALNYTGGNEFFARTMARFLSSSGDENRVVSPLNIYMALAMVAETAGGDSRAQILDLLGVEDLEALREQVCALWNGTYQKDEYATTLLANSLWLDQDLTYSQKTTDILARSYYASTFQGEMGSPEYSQTLRDWVDLQTGGLLEEQAEGLALYPDTVLALVSTIYYQAMWKDDFSPEDTAPGTFHAPGGDVACDFMHGSSLYNAYYRGENFTAASRYLSESGDMWFILPDEGTQVDELLDSPALLDLLEGNYESEGVRLNLTVPKFDVCSKQDLREGLRELGITDVFSPERADFSPLLENGEGTSISRVEHAARVSIDEEGCTGAAYTAVFYAGAGPNEPKPVDLILDRPFLFVLTSDTGLPLFAGVVNEPQGN